MKMHDGCVHRGLRYSAYLRNVSPEAYVKIERNDGYVNVYDSTYTHKVIQRVPTKLFGITVSHETRSLTKIVELAIAKIEEYDAVLETYAVEEEE